MPGSVFLPIIHLEPQDDFLLPESLPPSQCMASLQSWQNGGGVSGVPVGTCPSALPLIPCFVSVAAQDSQLALLQKTAYPRRCPLLQSSLQPLTGEWWEENVAPGGRAQGYDSCTRLLQASQSQTGSDSTACLALFPLFSLLLLPPSGELLKSPPSTKHIIPLEGSAPGTRYPKTAPA